MKLFAIIIVDGCAEICWCNGGVISYPVLVIEAWECVAMKVGGTR